MDLSQTEGLRIQVEFHGIYLSSVKKKKKSEISSGQTKMAFKWKSPALLPLEGNGAGAHEDGSEDD